MANPWKRNYTAPPTDQRCKADITLRDGSGSQCMRKAVIEGMCRQHDAIRKERGGK